MVKKSMLTILSWIPAMMLFVFLTVACFFWLCACFDLNALWLINRTSTQIVIDSYTNAILKLLLFVSALIVSFLLYFLLHKRYWFFFSLVAGAGSIVFFINADMIASSIDDSVVISEVCASGAPLNREMYPIENLDYFEIYNGTDYSVNLTGWSVLLGDEKMMKIENPFLMEPHRYYCIVCNNRFREESLMQGIPYVYVNLPVEGETIGIADKTGKVIDNVEYPQLLSKHVYARINDGAEPTSENSYWAKTENATPGWKNSEIIKETLSPPNFSNDSGFYDNGFYLTLDSEDGGTIYYTLDGSEPTDAAIEYCTPIFIDDISNNPNCNAGIRNVVYDWKDYTPPSEPVDKANVVRAVIIDDAGNCSEVVSKTYFVNLDKYKSKNVISLIIEPNDMFGDDGIYVTGRDYDEWYLGNAATDEPVPNFMKDKVKEGFCEFFDNRGEVMEGLDLEIKLQGASARLHPQKRIALTAKDSITGQHFFLNQIFDYRIHSINLRDDWYDAVLQKIVASTNTKMVHQDAQPVVLFINGEYWYDTFLRPRYNEYQIAQWFNLNKSDVYYVKDTPLEIVSFLDKNPDLSDETAYDEFSDMLDIDDYIDFMSANIYFCNMDLYDHKNVRMWKNLSEDSKWHSMLYDMDCVAWVDPVKCGGVEHSYQIDSFAAPRMYSELGMDKDLIFNAVKGNPEFRRKFVTRFLDLSNTAFSMEQISPILNEYKLPNDILDSFFVHRSEYIVPAMAEEFALMGDLNNIRITVDENDAGRVRCNTVELDFNRKMSWTGKYYSDFPVEIEAMPNPGYRFLYWETKDGEHVSESSLNILLTQNESYKACFEKIV